MLLYIWDTYFHTFEIPILLFLIFAVIRDFYRNGFILSYYRNRNTNRILIVLGLYIVFLLISSLYAIKPTLAFKDTFKWVEIYIFILLLFVYLNNEKRFYVIYWILFLATFLFIFDVIIRFLLAQKSLLAYRILPGYESAFAFALLLPFSRWEKKFWPRIALVISFLAVLLSLSRGAWLALLSCIFFSFLFLEQKQKKFVKILVIFILTLVFAITPMREVIFSKISTILSEKDASNVERSALLRIGVKAFSEHPITGVGALNFPQYLIREGLTEGIAAEQIEIIEPHNAFVQVAAEEGIVGLFLFTLVFVWLGIMLWRIDTVLDRAFVYGLRGFFIVMCTNLIFGYIASQFRFFLAIFIGLTLSLTRISKSSISGTE